MKITAELLKEKKACPEGIEAFEALYPRGVTYSKAWHKRMLSGPLAEFEGWAVEAAVIPALVDSAGDHGTAIAGYRGAAIAGDHGTAIAGWRGTATAGDYGTATAGNYGTAIAGDRGTATAGDYGTATAGECGTASACPGGELHIRWYDAEAERYRTSTAYVGEDGILPGTKYQLDSRGNFTLVK